MKRERGKDIQEILGADTASSRRRRLKITLGILFLAAALALGARVFSVKKSQGTVQYKTSKVTRGDLTMTVTATGNLQPLNQVDVGVEVSGTIDAIEVDYNDPVRQGQVLARLDTSKLEAQVLQAKAALDAAKAKVLKARANLKQAESKFDQMKRARELSGGRVPSQVEMDVAEAAVLSSQADLDMAQAEVDQAEAALKMRETDLSKAVIRSPINGIVLSRHVEKGQTVAASLQTPVLFTLAEDLREMELHVDVDEADVGQVREGQKASFTVDAYPDRVFSAKVTEVRFAPKTVEGVVTYETVLSVDNSDLSLRPGMTATADIVVKHVKDAVLVPNAALRFRPTRKSEGAQKQRRGLVSLLLPHRPRSSVSEKGKKASPSTGKRFVWILHNGEPKPVEVTVGATDGRMTEVLSGDIRPGMKVLTGIVVFKK